MSSEKNTSPSQEDRQKADELFEIAKTHINNQDFEKAETYLIKSLETCPNAHAYHNLGTLRFIQGKLEEAVDLFHSAVKTEPEYHASYANLMRITHQNGDTGKALEYAVMAINADKENTAYKNEFFILLKNLNFTTFSPDIKKALTFCMEAKEGNLDYDQITNAWVSLQKADPELAHIINLTTCKTFEDFEKQFSKLHDYKGLLSRYLHLGLQNTVVMDTSYENFLTHLRHLILKDLTTDNVIFDKRHINLLAALAVYCFYTEYVFTITDKEKSLLTSLEDKLSSQKDLEKSWLQFILLACYKPVHQHPLAKQCQSVMQVEKTDKILGNFIKIVVEEPQTELKIKNDIKNITDIETQTSIAVQQQYEENPYPRWRYLPHTDNTIRDITNRHLGTEKLNILVAGTGTGKEAALFSRLFPDARITAIDLSRTSLAYGIRQSEKYGLNNIDFAQANILALESALEKESFDIITSSGVIHHLKDPEEGLKVLLKLLKKDGLLQLGLYSEIARKAIVKAREEIARLNIKDSPEDIRNFRKNIANYLSKSQIQDITKFRDYFTLSMCRDLLFHVMEHRYTIDQLDDMFNRHNMEFLGFRENSKEILPQYRNMFPDDPDMLDLKNWETFEQKNPDAFRAMYQFWSKKSG